MSHLLLLLCLSSLFVVVMDLVSLFIGMALDQLLGKVLLVLFFLSQLLIVMPFVIQNGSLRWLRR